MEEELTIRTEKTPNPQSLKYNVGRLLIPGGSANFPTPESAEDRSPLARRLFRAKGVVGVFVGSDFFTITRQEGLAWGEINEALVPVLEDFFKSGDPVLQGKAPAAAPMLGDVSADPALLAKIEEPASYIESIRELNFEILYFQLISDSRNFHFIRF